MEKANIDEQHFDTSNTLEEADANNGTVEILIEMMNKASTFGFGEKSWKTDFTLIVEGTRFHVAKTILALASPVFDRMFESDFKESSSEELELPGKKADDVNEFLIAIYPNTSLVLSKENALKVLPLAEEYQVLNLKRRCEAALLESIDALTSIEELYQLIKEAHLYKLKDLSQKCVSFVTEKAPEEIEKASRKIPLPVEPLRDIFQNLISRVKDLETSKLHLDEQLETYKTWKNCLSKSLRRSDVLKLKENLVWVGRTWIYMMDINEQKSVGDNVVIWNTKFSIQIEIKLNARDVDCIYINLKNSDKNKVKCEFQFQFVVVNKMPLEEHHSVKHNVSFRSSCQRVDRNIVALSAIQDPKKGFVVEGNVQLEVNVFMSEPEKLEAINVI